MAAAFAWKTIPPSAPVSFSNCLPPIPFPPNSRAEIPMTHSLAQVTLVVREYDEAIAFFTHQLGFHLLEDTILGDGKRWVVVAPNGSPTLRLLLACASTPDEIRSVGNQTGGRVFLFLLTDNFWGDYRNMQSR